MKKAVLSLIILSAAAIAVTQESMKVAFPSARDARLIPPKQYQIGLFQPLRFGLRPGLEVSTHPIWFFIIPNAELKWSHGRRGGFTLATSHELVYPTPLLRTIARKGIGGIISPEFEIPQAVIMNTSVSATRSFTSFDLSVSFGISTAVRSGPIDERTTIDLPLVFPRLNVLYHGLSVSGGTEASGRLFGSFLGTAAFDLLYCPSADEGLSFEQKAMIWCRKSSRFRFGAGFLLVYGDYPFGTQWHLLPLADAQWSL